LTGTDLEYEQCIRDYSADVFYEFTKRHGLKTTGGVGDLVLQLTPLPQWVPAEHLAAVL
jgi:hypothetical protein